MAITVKTLQGSNSLSADRITINDNFKINTNAINNLLGIINTTTGKFDNTGIGADNTITTDGITIKTSGLDIQGGDINVEDGVIKLLTDGSSIELGSDNSKIIDTLVSIGASGPNSNHVVGFENFIALEIPRMTTLELTNVILGATGPNLITFDSTANKFKGWNGTAWVELG